MDSLISRLIEFVMNHLFIVIFVIGLIYTMFFRKSPLERPANRPNNRMPDFGGAPVFPQKPKQTGSQAGGQPVEHKGPPPVERREPRPEFAEPKRPLERSEPMREHSEPVRPVYRSPEPVRRLEPEPEYRTGLSVSGAAAGGEPVTAPVLGVSASQQTDRVLTRDDLTRAVVWAEILGPPRSRRPFRR